MGSGGTERADAFPRGSHNPNNNSDNNSSSSGGGGGGGDWAAQQTISAAQAAATASSSMMKSFTQDFTSATRNIVGYTKAAAASSTQKN